MFGKPDKMDVRCHSDAEAARVSKNAHKESRESKGSEGNLPAAFLKEPQGAFSASGAAEDCNKSKSNSAADPDYCRRIDHTVQLGPPPAAGGGPLSGLSLAQAFSRALLREVPLKVWLRSDVSQALLK